MPEAAISEYFYGDEAEQFILHFLKGSVDFTAFHVGYSPYSSVTRILQQHSRPRTFLVSHGLYKRNRSKAIQYHSQNKNNGGGKTGAELSWPLVEQEKL